MTRGPEQSGRNEQPYLSGTLALLELLRANPSVDIRCVHGDESPAIGIYESPRGCVALPGIETQPLCPQHVSTNGSLEGLRLIVDLSLDGAWSEHRGEVPDFLMTLGPITQLVTIEDYPTPAV